MDTYSETRFLNDFMTIYNINDEYDFSILFDDYFYQIISTNFLKSVYEYYHINNHDQQELYHHLYNIVEKMIIDKYDSDADTVVEE